MCVCRVNRLLFHPQWIDVLKDFQQVQNWTTRVFHSPCSVVTWRVMDYWCTQFFLRLSVQRGLKFYSAASWTFTFISFRSFEDVNYTNPVNLGFYFSITCLWKMSFYASDWQMLVYHMVFINASCFSCYYYFFLLQSTVTLDWLQTNSFEVALL